MDRNGKGADRSQCSTSFTSCISVFTLLTKFLKAGFEVTFNFNNHELSNLKSNVHILGAYCTHSYYSRKIMSTYLLSVVARCQLKNWPNATNWTAMRALVAHRFVVFVARHSIYTVLNDWMTSTFAMLSCWSCEWSYHQICATTVSFNGCSHRQPCIRVGGGRADPTVIQCMCFLDLLSPL